MLTTDASRPSGTLLWWDRILFPLQRRQGTAAALWSSAVVALHLSLFLAAGDILTAGDPYPRLADVVLFAALMALMMMAALWMSVSIVMVGALSAFRGRNGLLVSRLLGAMSSLLLLVPWSVAWCIAALLSSPWRRGLRLTHEPLPQWLQNAAVQSALTYFGSPGTWALVFFSSAACLSCLTWSRIKAILEATTAGHCSSCGFDLSGLGFAICPECGASESNQF
jgi:hypothetical protein